MDILWWHWLAAGLVLVGLELVIPSFTIVWFGLGAVVVGIVLAFVPEFPLFAQMLTWTVVSVLLTLAWFRFFNSKGNRTFSGSSKDAVLGEVGLVIRHAAPYDKGRVKFQLPVLGADEWPCTAEETLEVGDRVKILDVEGHVLKVEKTVKGAKQ